MHFFLSLYHPSLLFFVHSSSRLLLVLLLLLTYKSGISITHCKSRQYSFIKISTMPPSTPSYRSAASTRVASPPKYSFESQVEELSQPTPQSMTLVATLQLLVKLETKNKVFLIPRSYLQNWLTWAYHQKVTKTETNRVEGAARLAAAHFGLEVPYREMPYADPGPVDATNLSVEGHPLLLAPNVLAVDGTTSFDSRSPGNEAEKKSEDEPPPQEDGIDFQGNQILCCAVPEEFYETIRSVHGVVCNDGFSVSFQPFQKDSEALLHHHSHASSPSNKSTENGYHHENGGGDRTLPRPIEFRRKVIMKSAPTRVREDRTDGPTSPMTKLLNEHEKLSAPKLIPTVEIYPFQLNYQIVDENNPKPNKGFVLVSQTTRIYDALQGLLKVTASKTSSSCKRVWSKRDDGMGSGDGYEVIDLQSLDGKLLRKTGEKERHPQMLTGEWVTRHGAHFEICNMKEINVLVEIRRPNAKWERAEFELENRIKAGDFVDAQDVTGKWFEAQVREVTDDTVKVHYLGWASKWNATIRRRMDVEAAGAPARIHPVAPIWTHTNRWRERMTEGKIVEVRDASSIATRPKWYKGIIVKVGPVNGKLEKIEGGAELELFDNPSGESNGGKNPMLLMNQTRQVLVEVEQELEGNSELGVGKSDKNFASISNQDSLSSETLKPQPPYIRWVNLYGEEICEAGTHMKLKPDGNIAVVTLRYEVEAHRKPVEVMKSWNNMYGQGFMKESLIGTPPAPGSVGMHNLGNSCFLNSIIQCLNHINPITRYFLKDAWVKDLNTKNPLGSGGRVASAYASLLKEIWSGKYAALAPRMLKQTVASFAPQFNNSYQHDSQEFYQFLMDGLHEDCNRVKTKPYVEELEGFGMEDEKAAIETWRKHLLRHDSVVVDFCQGMHRSHLTCPTCGRESIKFDVFSTISLPLAQDKGTKVVELEDCIEKFMEGEQLDDLNAWYCPGCKRHVCALKMIALWSVPDVLIVHLKRFQFDHCSVSNQVLRSKIDDTVRFPIEGLDLRKHVLGPIDENAPPVYKLFGVSEHSGATANSGHYTATVRNSMDGRWHRYNDAHVGETTGDATVTGGAYLLFYQREKGSARWAGMEKVMREREIDPHDGMEKDQDGFTKVKANKKKPA